MAARKRKPCNDCFAALLRRAAKDEGIDKLELARRLGVWRSRVYQILEHPNMTERVFRDAAAALGYDVEIKLVRRRNGNQK